MAQNLDFLKNQFFNKQKCFTSFVKHYFATD